MTVVVIKVVASMFAMFCFTESRIPFIQALGSDANALLRWRFIKGVAAGLFVYGVVSWL